MFRYDYIAVVDIDEVIMPLKHRNWNDLIREIKRKTSEASDNITSFVFRHVLFPDEMMKEEGEEGEGEKDIPEWLHMMRRVYRSALYFPPGQNVKSLHRTEVSQAVHNHYGLSCLGLCRPHHVLTDLAQLNHYRRGCPASVRNCSSYDERVRDTAVWRIKDQVITNSLTSLRNINITSKG